MLPHDKALGIITAKSVFVDSEVLKATGVPASFERLVIAGLEDGPRFAAAFLTYSHDLDVGAVVKETLDAAVSLVNNHRNVGMLLFECSELPPYAAAVQRATSIPVFDFTSMVEFVVGSLIRQSFIGLD